MKTITSAEKRYGIIYVRVSSEEQVQGTSLADQEARCLKYCQDNGIEVVQVFREEGASAKTANRKVLLEAMAYCRKNKGIVSAFVVWKVDRFARNTDDHFGVRKTLFEYGVKLHSVSEPIADGHIGKLIETVLAGTAEFDNAVRTERSINGSEKRLMDGIWPHTPPVGYICAHNKKNGQKKTEPDKPDMRVFGLIQECLRGYAREVYTASDILEKLRKTDFERVTCITLRYQVVDRMLGNHLPFYAGLLYNAYAATRGDKNLYEPGKHQAMITIGEMETIKAIKSGKRPSRVGKDRYNPDFPLRRIVLCQHCGKYLTGSTNRGRSKRYSYYFCLSNKACPAYNASIPKQDMEDDFGALLRRIKPSPRFFDCFREAAVEYWTNQRNTLTARTKQHQARLEELKAQRKNVFLMLERGTYDDALFRERLGEIDGTIATESFAMKESRLDNFDMATGVGFAEQFISDIEARWAALNPQFRPRFQKVVFPAGISYDKKNGFGTVKTACLFELNEEFGLSNSSSVPRRGLEPPIPCGNYDLNVAWLPISPPGR